MTDAIRVSSPVTGTEKTLSFEAGNLAQLADGAVVARLGDTIMLATVAAAKSVREGIDFFPLTVDIEERAYAAGKIPGAFFRREGKPSDQAVLTCRLIDRPLRPSFPKGFRNEVQVVGTIFSADQENPLRRVGHQRRLGRVDDLGHPLRGTDRRRAHGLHHRR
jgi:polyribonucleotide nucleotidyltransferase